MTSLTKPDPGTVLCGVPDNASESSEALDQRVQAIQDRLAALNKQRDTLFAQPLPSHPIEADKLLAKRINILKEILATTKDLLCLLSEYD